MTLRTFICNLIRFLVKCEEDDGEARELHRRTLEEIGKTTEKLTEMNGTLMKVTTAYKIHKATGRGKKT